MSAHGRPVPVTYGLRGLGRQWPTWPAVASLGITALLFQAGLFGLLVDFFNLLRSSRSLLGNPSATREKKEKSSS